MSTPRHVTIQKGATGIAHRPFRSIAFMVGQAALNYSS